MIRKTAILLSLIAAGMLCLNSCDDNVEKSSPILSDSSQKPIVTEIPEVPPVIIECNNTDIHKGRQILVNRNYAYSNSDTLALVNIYENKNECYSVNTTDMLIDSSMMTDLNAMLSDFAAATGVTDVLANSGYRSYDVQQQLYNDDLALSGMTTSQSVAPPGNSEHHTGYAMDFAINDGEAYPALKNEGSYSWIYENADRYGMILRYTESNTSVTGYMPESWHFRYVGKPHAAIIKRVGMAYEDYLKFLRDFSFEEPLEYRYSDNEFYKIYYVPADTGATTTKIPVDVEVASSSVPEAYYISGNNIDGFIVTVKVAELSEDYNENIFDMFKPIEIPVFTADTTGYSVEPTDDY